MYPQITIGDNIFNTYGLLAGLGLVLSALVIIYISKSNKLDLFMMLLAFLFGVIGLVIGAKFLYFLVNLDSYIENFSFIRDNLTILQMIDYMFSGFVFYGGMLGSIAGVYIFCKIYKYNFSLLSNYLVVAIPLMHSIGRLGCFSAGCCYGIPYDGIFKIDYNFNSFIPSLSIVTRFPVQLLESAFNFLLFLFLLYYQRKPRKAHLNLGIYFVAYSLARFLLEFLRGDIVRGFIWNLSTSQWISLILFPIGIYLILRKEKESPE